MIRLESVYKSYDDKPVLEALSFEMREGDFFFIKGKSGVGKTTLLNIIATSLLPESGRVFLFEKRVREFCPSFRLNIGFVQQKDYLLEEESVFNNVSLPLKLKGYFRFKNKVLDILEVFNLSDKKDQIVSTLCGSERKKVGVCMALVSEPKILLADEPTTYLDQSSAFAVMDSILKLNLEKRTTTLIVTHDDLMITKYDKPAYLLKEGKLYEWF